MNSDVEFHIRHKYSWAKLPAHVKQLLGNSHEEYEKSVVNFSICNQHRYKGNLVRTVMKDEKQYYENLLQYSRDHLMLFPYHLSDVIVKGMRMTPFQYYISMMQDLMAQEKSYDSLPNFTAADCLRLLGIGRNQYIDLMNQCRSAKKFFRRKSVRGHLPAQPILDIVIEPWWVMQVGFITEDDIKMVTPSEKLVVDKMIDNGPQKAGDHPYSDTYGLYRKGLIYLDVPIEDDDYIIVPPLESFVMNRVLGDYFETLLYKIFVSIDEHTTIAELANILQTDLQLVKNAVSMYCRLGIAHPKGRDVDWTEWHPSWTENKHRITRKHASQDEIFLLDFNSDSLDKGIGELEPKQKSPETVSLEDQESSGLAESVRSKRIALLFDSTLTAFLMMGNLSSGLKSHAVTMFEVGKLPDESMDSLLVELEKIADVGEGEAQRYFDHALTLRSTILFLRNNRDLLPDIDSGSSLGVDLIRCESLQTLEQAACTRFLSKNYKLLLSMAPLSHEVRPVMICNPHHLGPAIPEVNSVWFKLFIYQLTQCGPPTLLLSKGSRLRRLPEMFLGCDHILVTTWGHDPGVVPMSNALLTLNDALTHSSVLVQVYGKKRDGETLFIPLPLDMQSRFGCNSGPLPPWIFKHEALSTLGKHVDLVHCCGYITLLRLDSESIAGCKTLIKGKSPVAVSDQDGSKQALLGDSVKTLEHQPNGNIDVETADDSKMWVILDCCFGLPLFDLELNRTICHNIASHKLCTKESLEAWTFSSRRLTIELLDFIAAIQDMELTSEKADLSTKQHAPQDWAIPVPCKNLIFCGGSVKEWNGR